MKHFLKTLLKMIPLSPQRVLDFATRFAYASGKRFSIFNDRLAGKGKFIRMATKSSFGFWYCGNFTDSADISFGVFRSGFVEKRESLLIRYLIKSFLNGKNKVVFYDIGANTGYFSILASYLWRGRVLSCGFEPVRDYFEIARQSAILNRLEDNCRFFNVGLGDKNQRLLIQKSGTGSSFLKDFIGKQKTETDEADVCILDEFKEENSLPDPDIILVDVEGYENQVFLGAKQTIKRYCPAILFESATTFKERGFTNLNFNKTQEFLSGFGYEIFILGESEIRVFAGSGGASDGVNMFLALHKTNHLKEIEALIRDYPKIISEKI